MEAGDGPIAANDGAPGGAGVGATLRARRLELGMSQGDVASIVKLPARRIEAMEQERWNELPDGPYLRGFLRNVARALELDPLDLLARVEGSASRPPASEPLLVPPGSTHVTLPRRSGPAEDRRGGRPLVFGAFAFALVAALIAWSGTDSFDRVLVAGRSLVGAQGVVTTAAAPAGDRAVPAASPASALSMPTGDAAPLRDAATGDVAASNAPGAAAPVAPAAEVATAAVAPASPVSLWFHFAEESWVEVRSADGKVLLQRLNAAGSEQQVLGEAPYTLVVGNAKGVTLQFRGQPVDLTPYTRDSVARFKLS